MCSNRKSIIGEIWRIPKQGVIINGDDGKDYVLFCDQKIRYIFFPFLLWMCPLEIIEVKKNSIRQARDNSWVGSIAPAIALTIGTIGAKLADQISINIPIPTSYYWVATLGIGLLLRIVFRCNKRPSSDSIITIHHGKFRPLKKYYLIRAFGVWITSVIIIFLITLMSSASFTQGKIIILVAIICLSCLMMWYNYPFIDVAKAKITFLD
nr:DUF443 family protein [uncultured Ligilactobacillus sp.]